MTTRTEIKRWFAELGWTNADAARALGVSRAYVSQIVNGQMRVSDSVLDGIHAARTASDRVYPEASDANERMRQMPPAYAARPWWALP